MQSLPAHTILQLWEVGQRQHPAERMVTLLAAALPDVPRSTLLNLSVGQRDAYDHAEVFVALFLSNAYCLLAQQTRTISSQVNVCGEPIHPIAASSGSSDYYSCKKSRQISHELYFSLLLTLTYARLQNN